MSVPPPQRLARRQLIGVGLLFLVAPLAALLLYFVFPQWIPHHTTNHGVLNTPAQPLPRLMLTDAQGAATLGQPFADHWTLILVGTAPCDAGCLRDLTLMRNLRELLRGDRRRLVVSYVTTDAADALRLRGSFGAGPMRPVQLLVDHAPAGRQLRDVFAPAAPRAIYLVDPLGNWVLTYPAGSPMQWIYEDLKHLLRYSQIG
jgi:cytochrome oxidase Cu insertion factor (SCO1/SenC/PrrC family)